MVTIVHPSNDSWTWLRLVLAPWRPVLLIMDDSSNARSLLLLHCCLLVIGYFANVGDGIAAFKVGVIDLVLERPFSQGLVPLKRL